MAQRQQYAIVPREPTGDMVQMGQCYVGLFQVFTEMVKAAPPPPEQVLSDADISDLLRQYGVPSHEMDIIEQLIRDAERAVLHNLGAKNEQ